MLITGIKKERAKNKLEGEEECKAEIAKKMLDKNFPVKLIAELTKLPQKTILDPNILNFPARKEPSFQELDERIDSKKSVINEMLDKWIDLETISEKTGIPCKEILKYQFNTILTINFDKNNEFWQKGKIAGRCKIAKNMHKKAFKPEQISEMTDLNLDEVKKLLSQK